MFATSQPLCRNGSANAAVSGNQAAGCVNSVEVEFIWEKGVQHSWDSSNVAARWQFFVNHPKP
jgi:hypothetical protein